MKIESEVLNEDLRDAKIFKTYILFCIAQMDRAVETLNSESFDFFSLECKRAMNDLKHLKFKKQLSERKMRNED